MAEPGAAPAGVDADPQGEGPQQPEAERYASDASADSADHGEPGSFWPRSSGAEDGDGRGSEDQSDDLPNFLPPFADARNRQLNEEVVAAERAVEKAEALLEENVDRVAIMAEHLRNVQAELTYTQARADAKRKEAETEEHLRQLNAREAGRLEKERKAAEAERAELLDKAKRTQQQILKGTETLDQFRLLMNWNQEELENWALASRQKEEDNLALQKYRRADDARVKELNLAIEKTTKSVSEKKAELEAEVTESQAAQIQLYKTADDFAALHAERTQLVHQWEEAVEAMQRRDAAIAEASELFAQRRAELRELQQKLDERGRFLAAEVANNRERQAAISQAERGVDKLRKVYGSQHSVVQDASDEVHVMKNTLTKAQKELGAQKQGNKTMGEELAAKTKRLDDVQKRLASTQAKLDGEHDTLLTLEERADELAKMQAEEEASAAAVAEEVTRLKDSTFKHSQELFSLRGREKDLIAEIAGCQSQNKNVTLKLSALDANVVKQQELLYAAEFKVQQMERKVARAGGVRSDDEKRVLNARIEKLTEVLEEKIGQHAMLSGQVKRAEDALQGAQRRAREVGKEAEDLSGKISELSLETDSTARSLRATEKEKEDTLVSHDVLRLEAKRLRDLLSLRADEVYGLENRKFELQMSMEERRHEIEAHREVLRAELKSAQEGVHKATLEVKERATRVERLQSRYEVLVGRMRPSGDQGDGEEHTQAYHLIKAAQERETLQREGDALDAGIRKAEKEIKALEATLSKLNGKNSSFRGSFRRAESSDQLREQDALREKLDRAYDRMKFKRAEERALMQDVEQYQARLRNARGEEDALAEAVGLAQQRAETAAREVEDQEAKLGRALRKVDRLRKEHRMRAGVPADAPTDEPQTTEEVDFLYRETREANKQMLHELAAVAADNPSVAPLIEERLAGVGLSLPSRPPSRASSAAASSASGVSATSSRAGRALQPKVIGLDI